MYYTEARTDFLTYSDPVLEIKDVFIAKDNQLLDYQDLNELKALEVAAVRGSLYAEQLSNAGFKVTETNDDLQAFRMLLKGRVGLVLSGEKHFQHLIDTESDLKEHHDAFVVLRKPYATNPLYVPILKSRVNSQQIIDRFNKSLSGMKQDGSLKSIIKAAGFKP